MNHPLRVLLCLLALAALACPTARATDAPDIPTAPLPPDLSLDTTTATAALPPSSSELDAVRHQIARVLATYRRRPLNTLDHTPWEVMH